MPRRQVLVHDTTNDLGRADSLRAFIPLLVVALAMLVPTLIGIRVCDRFSEAGFRRLVLGLLALSGNHPVRDDAEGTAAAGST
jgi:hypothetical protein